MEDRRQAKRISSILTIDTIKSLLTVKNYKFTELCVELYPWNVRIKKKLMDTFWICIGTYQMHVSIEYVSDSDTFTFLEYVDFTAFGIVNL